jgi:SNF2 family DNA or RNA helicase
MMLQQKAIDKFVARQRCDLRASKDWDSAEVERRAADLELYSPLWTKLRLHQKICFLLGVQHPRLALWLATGCGKTLLSIALIEYLHATGKIRHALVLVPRRANKTEWRREIDKHSPGTSYQVLTGPSKQKWEMLHQPKRPLITIETYIGLVRMCSDVVDAGKRKRRNELVPNRERVKLLQKQFQALIADESTSIKNNQSLAYRICRKLSERFVAVFALSGTPFGRDPGDLWAQMRCVDHGHALGETLTLFRSVFFSARTNPWSGGFEYIFIKRTEKLLHRMLAHSSINYVANEADLPQVSAIIKHVGMQSDARDYYQRAKQTIKLAKGNYRETRNAFLRMRQISSGFVGFHDDESGQKVEVEFPINPKLDLLMGLVESIAEDQKIIIFHDFIWSGQRIAKELKKIKIGFAALSGSTPTRNVEPERWRFDHDPNCRVLILSNALAIGLNLQTASYGIFFESPVSVIMRVQACTRFERQESKHRRVFRYDLVMRGTVDEQILAFHRQGKDLFKAIINGEVVL